MAMLDFRERQPDADYPETFEGGHDPRVSEERGPSGRFNSWPFVSEARILRAADLFGKMRAADEVHYGQRKEELAKEGEDLAGRWTLTPSSIVLSRAVAIVIDEDHRDGVLTRSGRDLIEALRLPTARFLGLTAMEAGSNTWLSLDQPEAYTMAIDEALAVARLAAGLPADEPPIANVDY